MIRESGLVATIGYLITEAETIWITSSDGRAIPGHALAYDQESGFGLVQALGRLDLPALEMGDSDRLKVGDQVVFAAGGGRHHAVETRVVGRQEFAGYWEYVLDDAIFTAPAHPFWGGGGLIGSDGKLMGIGSLILQQGDGKGRRLDMNMVVPIGLLTPIMKDLLSYGRVNRPARPWLGMYATEADDSHRRRWRWRTTDRPSRQACGQATASWRWAATRSATWPGCGGASGHRAARAPRCGCG